jgi:hypothetical protein
MCCIDPLNPPLTTDSHQSYDGAKFLSELKKNAHFQQLAQAINNIIKSSCIHQGKANFHADFSMDRITGEPIYFLVFVIEFESNVTDIAKDLIISDVRSLVNNSLSVSSLILSKIAELEGGSPGSKATIDGVKVVSKENQELIGDGVVELVDCLRGIGSEGDGTDLILYDGLRDEEGAVSYDENSPGETVFIPAQGSINYGSGALLDNTLQCSIRLIPSNSSVTFSVHKEGIKSITVKNIHYTIVDFLCAAKGFDIDLEINVQYYAKFVCGVETYMNPEMLSYKLLPKKDQIKLLPFLKEHFGEVFM